MRSEPFHAARGFGRAMPARRIAHVPVESPITAVEPALRPIAVGVHEIAALIGLSPGQVEVMTRRGELPVFRAGKRLLYPLAAVEQYMVAKALAAVEQEGQRA